MFLEQTCLGRFSAMFFSPSDGDSYMPAGAPVSGLALLQRHIKAAHDCALQEEQARQHWTVSAGILPALTSSARAVPSQAEKVGAVHFTQTNGIDAFFVF